jgi:DNA-binding transcriptional LysR family regulator
MFYIHPMKLNAIDLNLLVALEALLSEQSVGRAAVRLGLSQPATSHALRRLRHLLGDPLLVRVGHAMQLTQRAESLRDPLRLVLDSVQDLLRPDCFDPASSRRRFRLMMPDLTTSILMPALVEHVSREAPDVVLEIVGWRGPDMMTPSFSQSVDLIVSWTGDAFAGFHCQPLYRDRDALACRRERPRRVDLSTIEGFLAARHISVVGSGEPSDPVDVWLAGLGLERRVGLVVPTYLQALQVASISDLVAFAPGRMIAALAEQLRLAMCPPPVDPGEDQQFLFYPVRAVRDGGSIWLRELVRRVCDAMPAGPPDRA